jgi:hypothetical protein
MPQGKAFEKKKKYTQFACPEDILVDKHLSAIDKDSLLEDWKTDLELLVTATEENMPDQTGTKKTAPEDLLQRVGACRRQLEQAHKQA